MAKKIVYRGLELEALKKVTLEEFMKMLPSKTRRALKRMSPQMRKFLDQFRKPRKKTMRTQFRQMVIVPEMLGARIQVHNGKEWMDVECSPEMLGHRLGEYSITCKMVKHSGPGIGATRGSKSVELK